MQKIKNDCDLFYVCDLKYLEGTKSESFLRNDALATSSVCVDEGDGSQVACVWVSLSKLDGFLY